LELLIGIIILAVLIVGGVFLFNTLRTSPTGSRAARAIRSQIDTPRQTRQREPSLETLEPNDAIAFGDGGHALVVSVLDCSEQVGSRTTAWRWAFLDDGKLIEAGPEGRLLFEPPTIAHQGGETFQQLVADAEQGGVLKLFEQRVRSGGSATNPTVFEQAGQPFTMKSTGTFAARASGQPLGEVFRDVSPQAGENVYFEAEADNGDHLLGIWTTHIALLVGRPLGLTDVDAIYAGGEETE
jgi:hypothetical protein